jgi:hypothetical protein
MKFNTNRSYDANGKIIYATDLGNGRVHFVDVSRGLDGVVLCNFNERDIMRAYDAGKYSQNYLDVNESIALRDVARELQNEYRSTK